MQLVDNINIHENCYVACYILPLSGFGKPRESASRPAYNSYVLWNNLQLTTKKRNQSQVEFPASRTSRISNFRYICWRKLLQIPPFHTPNKHRVVKSASGLHQIESKKVYSSCYARLGVSLLLTSFLFTHSFSRLEYILSLWKSENLQSVF